MLGVAPAPEVRANQQNATAAQPAAVTQDPSTSLADARSGRDDRGNQGVTPLRATRYNNCGMFSDAPSAAQFALARVLAALPGVPAPLFGSAALAGASQLVR